jgi:hypothetical protein
VLALQRLQQEIQQLSAEEDPEAAAAMTQVLEQYQVQAAAEEASSGSQHRQLQIAEKSQRMEVPEEQQQEQEMLAGEAVAAEALLP